MKNTKIGQILKQLLDEKKMRVAELARLINLPQPTVHRIVSGVCEHPHISSLQPIADFFSISIDQLKGHEPIFWLDKSSRVPLLSWDQVLEWPKNKKQISAIDNLITDANVGSNGYAIKLEDASMDPVFPKETILIADPDKGFRDRNYVLAKLSKYPAVIFRQLLINAGNYYLKPLSPDLDQYKMIKLGLNDKIISVVVQARRNCETG